VLTARLCYSLRALNHQDAAPLRGLRRIGALVLIVLFSGLDMLGALCRGLGIRSAAAEDPAHSLSYHQR
jgi:hypothetical protein